MGVTNGGQVWNGAGLGEPLRNAGAPVAGTSEVQTITIGGTPTGGTFTLSFEGQVTGAITWSATNSTLIANIDAALEALPNIGVGGVATAAGSLTAGIGTITLTFGGINAKKAISTVQVVANNMTGTAPTIAIAETTPGVNATYRTAPTGAKLIDTTNGIDYINTSTTAFAPTFTKVGTQT